MGNIWIIIGREYMTRVKKKSFILLTILMPFLMAALVFAPMALGMIKGDEQKTVAILDKTGKYAPYIIDAQKADSTKANGYVFTIADKEFAEYSNEESDVDALILIDKDLTTTSDGCKIYCDGEVQSDLLYYVEDILTKQVRMSKLEAYDIPNLQGIIDDMQGTVSIKTFKWDSNGEELLSSTELAMILGLLSALLIYMFVLIYGSMVMQGVMEEKTNRIVEVIVSTVKPFQLMMGKLLGIMFVGFTQILIWGMMLAIIIFVAGLCMSNSGVDADALQQVALSGNMAGMDQQQMMEALAQTQQDGGISELLTTFKNLPITEIGVLFVIYFLGGYILYSSFYAAIGASINSQEDSAQFMMPMMFVMIFALYAAMGSMENTDGPLAFWASLFPLTSPVVMMVRLPFGVPLWQEILSVALLYATAIGFVWISGKIYRVGILMYGKKPSIKEIIKWVKYS